jgi:hypothetical protein
MAIEMAKILSHVPNIGIVQLPGRKYPSIAIQGDTFYRLLCSTVYLMKEALKQKNEETYFELLMLAEELQGQLMHYEDVLKAESFGLPYDGSASAVEVRNEWEYA